MDHLTFVSRLRLLVSFIRTETPLSKDILAFLQTVDSSPANTRLKSAAVDLLYKLFVHKSTTRLVLDLYRDLLPGLVARFLQHFSAEPCLSDFSLACSLHYLYPSFRPLVYAGFQGCIGRFNPFEALSALAVAQPRNEAKQAMVIEGLKAVHSLLLSSGVAYITGLWDCSSMLANTKSGEGFSDLWLLISLRIMGYSVDLIETSMGKERAAAVEALAMAELEGYKSVVEEPSALAHSLEPPTPADPFVSNADLAAGSIYYQHQDCSLYTTNIVFTKHLKRLHKLIIHDKKPVLVCGGQGCGKTTLIEELAMSWPGVSDKRLIQIYMDETLDAKSLVGAFVCSESFGEFTFKKGPLAAAAEQGWWVILENIDKANDDIMPVIMSLVERRELSLPTREGKVVAHSNFRIFATSQTDVAAGGKRDKKALSRYFHVLSIPEYTQEEAVHILKAKFAMYSNEELLKLVYNSSKLVSDRIVAKKANTARPVTFHDLMKLSGRIQTAVKQFYNGDSTIASNNYLVEKFRLACAADIADCLFAYLEQTPDRVKVLEELASPTMWNLDPAACVGQITTLVPKMQYSPESFSLTIGRCADLKFDSSSSPIESPQTQFAYTSYALRGFECIGQALKHNEGLLLVGPTGVGKTLIVQQMARMMNVKLVVYNMNCMSDASDLMGGFKPIAPKYLLLPFVEAFLKLFCSLVSRDSNQAFLATLTTVFNKGQYIRMFKCIEAALAALATQLKLKKDPSALQNVEKMQADTQIMKAKIDQMKGNFAYQYIEGALVKSLQNGDWVLLDELNLASDELLQKLAPIIEGRSLTVSERSDLFPVARHPKFRLICCMNPGGTVGKRQLPTQIRNKFTEIFMGDMEEESDVMYLIRHLMKDVRGDEKVVTGMTKFYLSLKAEAQQLQLHTVNNKKPTFSIRNLCRALDFIRRAAEDYGMARAVYDGVEVCLLSQLNPVSKDYAIKLLNESIPLKLIHAAGTAEKLGCMLYSGYNLPKGNRVLLPSEDPDKWFVTTTSFEDSLRQLAKIVANTALPILLEGHTSSGKTAMIEYLAAKTHNHCTRINNHLNTDVQEYIGSYVPDPTGKLYFQEGALIEAVRNGYWVILDELNLAPTEVLEALNRLLDDNREIYIPETQTMLKAHPMFRVFATQNPTEGYGGRKELSEAFKNRFIIIHVSEIPLNELATVVEKRCGVAPSFARRMVGVMEELQLNRRETDILSGKQSFITVRDLIKWATRPIITTDDIAYEGYILLAERLRNASEKEVVKKILEKHCKVRLDVKKYYNEYCDKKEIVEKIAKFNEALKSTPSIGGLTKISWTNSMKRLYAISDKCVKNKEPVLLVGETGCGKTTVCQLISLFEGIPMYTISCHQNTEAADFIGGLRTRTAGKSMVLILEEVTRGMEKIAEELDKSGNDIHGLAKEIRNLPQPVDFKLVRRLLSRIQNSTEKNKAKETSPILAKIVEILAVLNEENKLFEWKNGPLVTAMLDGGILLIDEISLTDDSVIERINSVLEKDRVLVLSEKSSESVEKYVAHEKFCVLATMNPGGDYGKKELSPALRNRFTEMWVDSFFSDEDFIRFGTKLKALQQPGQVTWDEEAGRIDLYQVICEKVKVTDTTLKEKLCKAILQFACWYNQVFVKEMNLERKALSLRDVLSILEFVSMNANKMLPGNCYRDALSLIVLDGLATNSDISSNQGLKDRILGTFEQFVSSQIAAFTLESSVSDLMRVTIQDTEADFGISPYFVHKSPQPMVTNSERYCLEVKTPKENIHRVLRAMSLDRPILLEGSPGVGKTSLIEYLARVTGKRVVSISLSEQTDMMDLLGCEYPVSSEHAALSGKPEFRWCDGVLLRAIKEGWWVLIDELNLASQSVLEGLNAILDHRKTIFIPELAAEFQCHPQFRFFATQSPARQGASRKNLPKSFLNRFAKIYLDSLSDNDLVEICCGVNAKLGRELAGKLIKFNACCRELKEKFALQSSIECNLRDVKKALAVIETLGLDSAITLIYLNNARTHDDRKLIKKTFVDTFGLNIKSHPDTCSEITVSNGFLHSGAKAQLPILSMGGDVMELGLTLLGNEKKSMENLMHCINFAWPMLVTGPEGSGKTVLIKKLAALTGNKVVEIIVGGNTDSSELMGFYEQANVSTLLLSVKERLEAILRRNLQKDPRELTQERIGKLGEVEKCRYRYKNSCRSEKESVELLKTLASQLRDYYIDTKASSVLADIDAEIAYLAQIEAVMQRGKFVGRFEWIDSELVKSIESGSWVIIKNANACNPSILDRINPLFDDSANSELIINEAGIIADHFKVVRRHPNFRLFFVYDHKAGELSRSLRNRCAEIFVRDPVRFQFKPIDGISAAKSVDIHTRILDEDWAGITALGQAVKFSKEYVQDSLNLLKTVGIMQHSHALSMLLTHHSIHLCALTKTVAGTEPHNSAPVLRTLLTWGRLCAQMMTVNSDWKKCWKWSCKIAYSQQVPALGEKFEEIIEELIPKCGSQKEGLEVFPKDIVAEITNKGKGVSTASLDMVLADFLRLHSVAPMISAPQWHWNNYANVFLSLLEFALQEVSFTSPEEPALSASASAPAKRGKREKSETATNFPMELRSKVLRNFRMNSVNLSAETISDLLLILFPHLEFEHSTRGATSSLKAPSIIAAACSEITRSLRESPEKSAKLLQLLTRSDISLFSIKAGTKGSAVDLSSYFPKKIEKLRRLVQSALVLETPDKQRTVHTRKVLQLLDFAYQSALASSNVGLKLFPCMAKLQKLLISGETPSRLASLIQKLLDKALSSCQLDKTVLYGKRNALLAEASNVLNLHSMVPKSEALYRAQGKLMSILSPLVGTVGNRQDLPQDWRVSFAEKGKELVSRLLSQMEEAKNAETTVAGIVDFGEIEQFYEAATAKSRAENRILIKVSEVDGDTNAMFDDSEDDDEDAPENDGTIRIPVVEKLDDTKLLKHKRLVDLPMVLKDIVAVRQILSALSDNTTAGDEISDNLRKRYVQRRTTVISQAMAVLDKKTLGTGHKLWLAATLVLSKALRREYLRIARGKIGLPSSSLGQLLLGYVRGQFSREMKLNEISFKMDYMLRLNSLLLTRYAGSVHQPSVQRIAAIALKTIISTANGTEEGFMRGVIEEFLRLAEMHKSRSHLYRSTPESALQELKACLSLLQKYKADPRLDKELAVLFVGMEKVLAQCIGTEGKLSLKQAERMAFVADIVICALGGKLLLVAAGPAVDFSGQIKLPVYIEATMYAVREIYEELQVQTWLHEQRTQYYTGNNRSATATELDTRVSELTKYRSRYRFRDLSKISPLISLITSLSLNAVSSRKLSESLLLLIESPKGTVSSERESELESTKESISQGLTQILTTFIDCNQDVLMLYVLGLDCVLKGYQGIQRFCDEARRERLSSAKDCEMMIKCGDLDYEFATKKLRIQEPAPFGRNSGDNPRMYKEMMEAIKVWGARIGMKKGESLEVSYEYVRLLAERYRGLVKESEEGQAIYKYQVKSMADKIKEKFKAIDEMTREENMAKKAEERKKELEEEFEEYVTSGQALKKLEHKAMKLQEKLENQFHRMMLFIADPESGRQKEPLLLSKMAIQSIKLSRETSAKVPSAECVLQTIVLAQDSLQVLSSRVASIDENITPPTLTYHFYKDPNPAEVKLVHNPVMQLLARIKSLLGDYPNNLILVTCAQMCDRLLAFDVWKTPVARIMAGLELITNKAHEWQALASKRLNSIDSELSLIYRIIVRYRKLQLVSWSSLFRAKIEECEKAPHETRVAALLVAQLCGETTESPADLYQLLDQYLLNSTMATFPYRYKVLCAVRNLMMRPKEGSNESATGVKINMVTYLTKYYGEYLELHSNRMKELKKPVSDKMIELIRISRWDITNYFAFQSCITRNHAQLMSIIKDFAYILRMPFSTSVLTVHRDRTILSEQHVFTLQQAEEKANQKLGSAEPQNALEELVEEIHGRIASVKESESKATRRRALIDLFKKLKAENVGSRYKQYLVEGAEMLYQKKHFESETVAKASKNAKEKESLKKSSRYYFEALQNLNVMLTLPAFHEHLSRQEIEAMKGFAYNLVVRMGLYAEKLCTVANTSVRLRKLLRKFPEGLLAGDSNEILKKTTERKALVEDCLGLWRGSYKIVVQLAEVHGKYTGGKMAPEITERIKAYLLVCEKAETLKKLEKDPVAYNSRIMVLQRTELEQISAELSKLISSLRNSAETVYAEPIAQLERYGWVFPDKLAQLGESIKATTKDNIVVPNFALQKILADFETALSRIVVEVKNAGAEPLPMLDSEETLLTSLCNLGIWELFSGRVVSGLEDAPDLATIAKARELLGMVLEILEKKYLLRGTVHVHDLSKCTHLITTIFANLLKNGFCVHDKAEDEDEAKENQKMTEELDGMGLGEGQGRQDISEQLQHEEQIEGMKGEAVQDDEAPGPEEKKDLDKGFEMEEDFEGKMDELGEEGKKEAEEKKEGDLQREMEENMGKGEENKLWNDENEVSIEEEEDKEPEGKVQDLTEKKPQPESKGDNKKEMKAAENLDKVAKGPEDEALPEGKQEEEEAKEFEEPEKDEEMHMEKNEQMEGLRSEDEEEKKEEKEEDGLSLSMNSDKDEDQEDLSSDKEEKDVEAEGTPPPEEETNKEEKHEENPDNKLGKEQKEEEEEAKEEEEIPVGASAEQNPNAESMPIGKEEDNMAVGESKRNQPEKSDQPLYSRLDIAQVMNEEFNKSEAKKQLDREVLKGKLGKNQDKNIVPNLTLTSPEEQKTEDRKAMEGDEVIPREENEEVKKEESAQAVGETMMDIGNENIAEPEEEKSPDQDNKDEEVPDAEHPSNPPEASKKNGNMGAKQRNADKNPEKENKQEEEKEPQKDEEMPLAAEQKPEEKKVELSAEELANKQPKKEDKKEEEQEIAKPETTIAVLTAEKYEEEKNEALRLYYQWLTVPEKASAASEMLQRFESLTRGLSASLCEQLRILLEPTQRTKLKGDYKTGKRLNMKKIIPFLASNYRNDKIWMRRSVPNKRDYKIMLMIDDSLSMKEHGLGFFALESVVAILQSLDILEVGEVCVGAMRERLKIVHNFSDKYTRQKAGFIISSFNFDYNELNSADYSMANCVNDANHMLELQRFDTRTICIILSDGRFNKANVRPYLVEAGDKGYTYVMIILDNYGSDPSRSILNMRSTKWKEVKGRKEPEIVPHLQDFPFEFYCVLQDISHLPFTLTNVLLNWFKQALWN